MTNEVQNISSSARPMATKPGRVVLNDEGISPKTWQINSLISPIPQGL